MDFTKIKAKVIYCFNDFLPLIVLSGVIAILLRISDAVVFVYFRPLAYNYEFTDLVKGILLDLSIISWMGLIYFIVFGRLLKKRPKIFKIIFFLFVFLYAALYLCFSFYTSQAELLPDSTIFSYNQANKEHLLSNYGYLWIPLFAILLFIIVLILMLHRIINKKQFSATKRTVVLLAWTLLMIIPFHYLFLSSEASESKTTMIENKVRYFVFSFCKGSSLNESTFLNQEDISNLLFPSENFLSKDFLLLRKRDTTDDVLSPYFNDFDTKPNLVFIILESLGRNYSGPDALYGSFTPFLDSLAKHSLYWYNFLATSGRTFGALPSVFASVPYGEKGFNELADHFPTHTSLLRNLKQNGYFISFFYGGWMEFDHMESFLRFNRADYLIRHFPTKYKKMGNEKFSWGYDDRTLFNYSLKVLDSFPSKPRVDIYLTLSNHSPWDYTEIEQYEKKLDQYFAHHPDLWSKQTNYFIKKRFASVLYMDDVLRDFFEAYKKRPDFDNTIFIITGDHGISYDNNLALKKFHVPLIIYSPKLKKTAVFKGVCSHLDIAPSVEQLLKTKVALKLPIWTCYLGSKLDTVKYFNIDRSFVFIWENRTFPDILSDNYYLLYKDSLFTVSDNFVQRSIVNTNISENMRKKRLIVSSMHKQLAKQNKIIPLSTFLKEYAIQIYPTYKENDLVEQFQKFNISDLNEEKEFENLFSLKCKQNNFGTLYTSGTIQLKLLSTESKTIKLVFEAKDSLKNMIGWQCFEFSLKTGETKSFDLNRYFILKQINTFASIKYIDAYFWNNKKASVQIQKLEMKTYIE